MHTTQWLAWALGFHAAAALFAWSRRPGVDRRGERWIVIVAGGLLALADALWLVLDALRDGASSGDVGPLLMLGTSVACAAGTLLVSRRWTRDGGPAESSSPRAGAAHAAEPFESYAGGVAHDLRNMLQVIRAQSEELEARLGPSHTPSQLLRKLDVATRQASELVERLAHYSTTPSPATRECDLAALLAEARTLLASAVPANVRLAVEDARVPLLVLGDGVQLLQVLCNLVINAGEALTERGGVVEVGLALRELDELWCAQSKPAGELVPGRYVCLRVADDGPGLAADVRERLFDSHVSTKVRGHGRGLINVYRIVCAHRGAIRVSTAASGGACFEVALPPARLAPVSPHEAAS